MAARLCKFAEDWKWSSASAHIKGIDDGLVEVAPMLEKIPAKRWQEYLADESALGDIGGIIKKHSRTGRPLGDDCFIVKLEQITGLDLAKKKPGPKSAQN